MGILRDILDTLQDVKSFGTAEEFLKTKKYSSLSKRSMEGTVQFPVIVSRSMDLETLQMGTKALERNFSSMLQIAMTMDPKLRLDKEKDAAGYLRKFHQNTGIKTDLRDVMNFGVDALESYLVLFRDQEQVMEMTAVTCEGSTRAVTESNKEQNDSVLNHICLDILNEKFVPIRDYYKFPDQSLSDYYNREVVTEANRPQDPTEYQKQRNHIDDQRQANQFKYRQNVDERDYQHKKQTDDRNYELSVQRHNLETEKVRNASRKSLRDMDVTYVPQNLLRDNDARKANELVPTTMHIRVILFDSEQTQQGFIDFIIGVKATMHPVPSEEMISNVIGACKKNSKVFNFLRWTTGEINFFKDFMFGIDEIKDDVYNRSSGASPWWITLKRRRALSKIKNSVLLPGQLLPNATLVMSMDEVEYIKSETGYDLMDTKLADSVMRQLFLLSIVVIDNASQIGHFLFDGQTTYQSYTFSALERENSNKADLKEVMKIINRTNMV